MQSSQATKQFLSGMYVRVPQDIDRQDADFREFRLGQIHSIDAISSIALIHFHHPDQDDSVIEEHPLNYLERCRILPDTSFILKNNTRGGIILIACRDEWVVDEYLEYYVLFYEEKYPQQLSEAEIVVSSLRQNPQPELQLQQYEFQNPQWKSLRDQVIESYYSLRNATFGIEDLVGSRVMLMAHQAEVVSHVLGDPECRFILADEVGLGKTIEACVILRSLQRRNPHMKTLIVVPSSLAQQWHNELNKKFWLLFPLFHSSKQSPSVIQNSYGVIVTIEEIVENHLLWQTISQIQWGLLIVDEAHHIRKSASIYAKVQHLSQISQRVLILSATPIQRRASEYLQLLALMAPHKYNTEETETFKTMLKAQGKIRRKVVNLLPALLPGKFDAEEFEEEIESVVHDLKHDKVLHLLFKQFSQSSQRTSEEAFKILAYISENYRIENRVIRNRRANLTIALPERKLDSSYSYKPAEEEIATLETLYDYLEEYIQCFNTEKVEQDQYSLIAEYCRILMHTSASSPHALLDILEQRAAYVLGNTSIPLPLTVPAGLLSVSTPRLESQRIAQVLATAPSMPEEYANYLTTLLWRTRSWLEQTDQELVRLSKYRGPLRTTSSQRLGQVLLALEQVATLKMKAVVFSSWPQTLAALTPHIEQRHGKAILAQFNATLPMETLENEVNDFQELDRCRILLCDELGGEGRNFQIASHIIHIDLPWAPTQVEQRIGRVDRLGREGTVLSIVSFAQDWPDESLFHIWQDAFHLFTESMSGLEITLEGVQNALLDAIMEHPRSGLANSMHDMLVKAEAQRRSVDEERFFEEIALNRSLRTEFEHISADYRDGRKLRNPILQWADHCGLEHDYDPLLDIVTYQPRRFNEVKRRNAKLYNFPNMEDALLRSGRTHELVLRGTFNREVAVQRENLVFFAPSSDKWTDAIIANALECDRGRCCAIARKVTEQVGTWQGIELLYSLSINPRPLYKAGFHPTHLFRVLGFLRSPLYSVAVSLDGKLLSKSSPIWKIITKLPYSDSRGDLHLGRREISYRGVAQIQNFKQQFPPEEWQAMLRTVFSVAEHQLEEEFSFMEDEAEEARTEFARKAAGLYAADLWLQRTAGKTQLDESPTVREYERVSQALVEGIRRPMRQLESVCFWRIEGK